MTDDLPDDPHLAVLLGIAAELTQIRRVLEAQQADADDASDATAASECRCGVTVADESAADTHAQDAHNAPPGAWRDVFETHQRR